MDTSSCADVHLPFNEDESECSTVWGSERGSSVDEHEQDRPASECPSDDAQTFSAAETLIVFDWDDTLFPTSRLQRSGALLAGDASALGADDREGLRELAEAVEATLREAALLGRVAIITNAEEGWVQDSCARFMPSLLPVLTGLHIVSARAAYEQHATTEQRSTRRSPAAWKSLAFETEVGAFYDALPGGQRGNCISIGDSVCEHRALLEAAQRRRGCLSKCLKFAERPSLGQLVSQNYLVGGSLEEVVAFDGDLDVDVSGGA